MVDWQSESDLDSIRNSCDVFFSKYPTWTFLMYHALTGNAGTEKCSSVVPDESLLDIPSMSEAVVKPVTSMMLLLLGRMAYC